MKHERINLLALLWSDLETKRAMHDVADANRDAWRVGEPAWWTASHTANAADASVTESEAILIEQCRRDGLTAEMLRGIAGVLAGQSTRAMGI